MQSTETVEPSQIADDVATRVPGVGQRTYTLGARSFVLDRSRAKRKFKIRKA